VLTNQSRAPFKAGTQAFSNYGKVNNAYFLENYGFAFKDNIYNFF